MDIIKSIDYHHEEEDEEDDDYSCTDESSTTSTSSTTNQQDNTRVCDCCYCEVFGHGTTSVAPTSRNFNEMRERLRQRLSKRRAEKCERTSQQQSIGSSANKPENPNDKGGDCKDSDCKDGDCKPDDNRLGTNQNNNNNSQQQQNKQPYAMEIDEILNFINGTSQDKSSKRKEKNKNNGNNSTNNQSNISNKKNKNKSNQSTTTITSVNAKKAQHGNKSNNPNYICQQQQHQHQQHQLQQQQQQLQLQQQTQQNRSSNNTESEFMTTPDDVFMPRNIDLNDGDLDEFERELEAFKRFCFDSVPLKERVRVQLKDSSCFKEFTQRFSDISKQQINFNSSKVLQRKQQQQSLRRKVANFQPILRQMVDF